MTKFEIGDKVRILDVSKIGFGAKYWSNGDILEVKDVARDGDIYLPRGGDRGCLIVVDMEFEYIEKVVEESDAVMTQKQTKNQRLSALEQQVAELQAEVATLKSYPKPTEIAEMFALAQLKAQKPTLHIGKASVHITQETPKLSANEQRKAIIAEAKAFVADVTAHIIDDHVRSTKYGRLNDAGYNWKLRTFFEVKPDKREVTVVLKKKCVDSIVTKGIAKCATDDVFNADIGKAIALGRALGLDVKRFEQAVKPTEAVAGSVAELSGQFFNQTVTMKSGDSRKFDSEACLKRNPNRLIAILDDTGAKY